MCITEQPLQGLNKSVVHENLASPGITPSAYLVLLYEPTNTRTICVVE